MSPELRVRVRVHFFPLVLGYSRSLFARAYPNEQLANLLAGPETAFAWFGGMPRELLFDNPKKMVDGLDAETGEVELKARSVTSFATAGTGALLSPVPVKNQGELQAVEGSTTLCQPSAKR